MTDPRTDPRDQKIAELEKELALADAAMDQLRVEIEELHRQLVKDMKGEK